MPALECAIARALAAVRPVERVRRHVGGEKRDFVKHQVASLSKVKNQRMLIDATAVMAKSVDVHLDLVGEDTLDGQLQQHARDDPYRTRQMAARARDWAITNDASTVADRFLALYERVAAGGITSVS